MLSFVKKNISVTNGTYAGGLAVKPAVLVQIYGRTLIEGKDYELTFYKNGKEIYNCTEVTDGKVYDVVVKGIGGYTGSNVRLEKAWGIDKKNINDCDSKSC